MVGCGAAYADGDADGDADGNADGDALGGGDAVVVGAELVGRGHEGNARLGNAGHWGLHPPTMKK
jgi:hypothetical protein